MKVAADMILVDKNRVLLVKRRNEPFSGRWALPGGFVEEGETVEEAAVREMREETGVDVELAQLLGVYSNPDRDPRGRVISAVYEVERADGGAVDAGTDASSARFWSLDDLPDLAFDHGEILDDFMRDRGMFV